MDNKIRNLYQSLYQMSYGYLIEQRRDGVEEIKKVISQIEDFIVWFLEGNKFGIEEELYQEMQNYLLGILKDITDAIVQGDRVLLHDAIAYGLMEYLKMFVDLEQEEKDELL